MDNDADNTGIFKTKPKYVYKKISTKPPLFQIPTTKSYSGHIKPAIYNFDLEGLNSVNFRKQRVVESKFIPDERKKNSRWLGRIDIKKIKEGRGKDSYTATELKEIIDEVFPEKYHKFKNATKPKLVEFLTDPDNIGYLDY